MANITVIKNQVTTTAPLTAEARETMIKKLFASMPHDGELFIPNDQFYITDTPHRTAMHMLTSLCRWLAIKPGYIGLELEGATSQTPDGQRYTIYLESKVLSDEFLLGATIAYALTRYLVEDRGQIRLPSSDQPAILATGSVAFGLGLVIVNGLLPSYGLFGKLKQRFTKHSRSGILAHNFAVNYPSLVKGFIKTYALNPVAYQHCLTPWAAKKLGLKRAAKPTHAVRDARHKNVVQNIKAVGIVWLTILVVSITGFSLRQRAKTPSADTLEAQQHFELLGRLTGECREGLAYQRQYADLTDIQTIRNLNSTELRCQSLNNQYDALKESIH